jgi:hypothetical protein
MYENSVLGCMRRNTYVRDRTRDRKPRALKTGRKRQSGEDRRKKGLFTEVFPRESHFVIPGKAGM